MDGDEQGGPGRPRPAHPLAKGNEDVGVAGHHHPHLLARFQTRGKRSGEFEDHILFKNARSSQSAGVDAPMPRVEHDHGQGPLPLRRGRGRWLNCGGALPTRPGRLREETRPVASGKLDHQTRPAPLGARIIGDPLDPHGSGQINHHPRLASPKDPEPKRRDRARQRGGGGLGALGRFAHGGGAARRRQASGRINLKVHLRQIDDHPIRIRQHIGLRRHGRGEVENKAGDIALTDQFHAISDGRARGGGG